ncbi:MAG: hypothetical protein RBU37_24475 [Myxococcota bacterium]|nr:hypothetical protein [Myxococcota bacterium]
MKRQTQTRRKTSPKAVRQEWPITGPLSPLLGCLLFCVGLLSACSGGVASTVFAPGIELSKLELAAWPEAGPSTEGYVLEVSQDGEISRAQLRGYVHQPLERVMDALAEPAVVSNRRRVSEYTVSDDVETGYARSFRTHNVVKQIITVSFDVTWRQGPVMQGEDVVGWMASFQKTDGTTYIDHLSGSMVAMRANGEYTAIELNTAISAVQSNTDDARQHLEDVWFNILAHCQQQPLPVFD